MQEGEFWEQASQIRFCVPSSTKKVAPRGFLQRSQTEAETEANPETHPPIPRRITKKDKGRVRPIALEKR
jgi:hypothetical protein